MEIYNHVNVIRHGDILGVFDGIFMIHIFGGISHDPNGGFGYRSIQ
jgi:hypothetical protein